MPEDTKKYKRNEQKEGTCTDSILTHECEEALFRLKHPLPPVHDEWSKLSIRIAKRKRLHRLRILIGTAVAAAILSAAWFITHPSHHTFPAHNNMAILVESEAEPPTPTLEETLPNAKTKVVSIPTINQAQKSSNGVIVNQEMADYTQAKESYVCQNIVSIPRGNVYKITLNDGTEVWLNASSKLFFPTRFTGNSRTVKLEGEAYFKVSKDEQHPFIIQTGNLKTEVLGTEFNVKAYPKSETHVTLVNGSVKVHLPQTQEPILLHPGDDICCTNDHYSIQQVDINYYTQWMEGYFYYDDVLLTDILKDLGRWYNITVAMEQDPFLLKQRLHFVAERNENIDQAIKNLNGYPYLIATQEKDRIVICRKRHP